MAVNTTVEVVMPPMGDSVSEGSVLEWHKQEGDEVAEDETLVEISTDKVDAEVPAPVSGTVVKIHAAEGDTVGIGAVLAEIAPMTSGNGASAAPAKAPEPTAAPRPAGDTETIRTPEGIKVTPVAARVAAAEGVDLEQVHGTGPDGRISKADV